MELQHAAFCINVNALMSQTRTMTVEAEAEARPMRKFRARAEAEPTITRPPSRGTRFETEARLRQRAAEAGQTKKLPRGKAAAMKTTSLLCSINNLWQLLQQQPFNGLFSRTTWVSRYQKGKTNLDFTGARESEWQWHQLGHMQVCTSLQTDNHASTPPLVFYRPDALPAAQPTASKH